MGHTSMIGDKYRALANFLRRQTASEVIFTFSEIEALIGAPLPPSAYKYKEWWSAEIPYRSQDVAWLDVGWKAHGADLEQQTVPLLRI